MENKGKAAQGEKEKWKWQVSSSNNTCTHTLARTHPFICPHWPTQMRASCNLLLWMQVHSNGHSHTSVHLRTHSPGLDVPDGGRRCCFSMNRLQFFAEGSGSTYTYARTHVRASTHAHGVNAHRRSLWVNVSAAIPDVAALIIFIYAFSNTEGERERER